MLAVRLDPVRCERSRRCVNEMRCSYQGKAVVSQHKKTRLREFSFAAALFGWKGRGSL